jgi:hypothetical protein
VKSSLNKMNSKLVNKNMKKYNMKINPHIVTLMIFLFVSSGDDKGSSDGGN